MFQNGRKRTLNDIKNVTCNSGTVSNILVGQNVFSSFLAVIYCQNKIFFNKHVHIKYSFLDRNKRIELLILRCFFNDLYFWTINLKSYRPPFGNQTPPSSNSFWKARIAAIGSYFQIPSVHLQNVKSTLFQDFNRRFGNAALFRVQNSKQRSPLN